ncbi:MAG TPA: PilW family protein [Rhodocyclaceae bacterium]|nr:PilW family protein [Rhodocyclaceae bacterium]
MTRSCTRKLAYQRGLTLIELMISLVISLVVSGVAAGVFISARQTARYAEALSRYQESLRFAQAAIAEDLRTAAQLGCRTNLSGTAITTHDSLTYSQPLDGLDAATTASTLGTVAAGKAKTGTDIMRLQFASRDSVTVTAATTGSITAATSITYAAGDPLVIADCTSADIFAVSTAATSTTITPTTALSRAYTPRVSEVYRFLDRAYYINSDNQLMQMTGASESILTDGIEDLQFSYGQDTDATPDGYPNRYVGAASVSDWTRVTAVRVCLLVRSKDQNLASQTSYKNCALTDTTSTDGRLRFPVNFTVRIRNRGL